MYTWRPVPDGRVVPHVRMRMHTRRAVGTDIGSELGHRQAETVGQRVVVQYKDPCALELFQRFNKHLF